MTDQIIDWAEYVALEALDKIYRDNFFSSIPKDDNDILEYAAEQLRYRRRYIRSVMQTKRDYFKSIEGEDVTK